jgi:hypothetical protein
VRARTHPDTQGVRDQPKGASVVIGTRVDVLAFEPPTDGGGSDSDLF